MVWFFKSRKSAKQARKQELTALVEQLAGAEFYNYAPAEEISALQADAIETGWLYGAPVVDPATSDDPETDLGPSTGRVYWADAEDLAEGGVGTFLNQIETFLEDQKVHLPAVEENCEEEYVIRIGNRHVTLYRAEELNSDEANIWGLTPARAFAMINRLLEESSSPERLYGINAANDLQAVFLTERQLALIQESSAIEMRDKPYRLTEEHPGYGYPE